jgi:GNAT superfamily N-acetyltransferase
VSELELRPLAAADAEVAGAIAAAAFEPSDREARDALSMRMAPLVAAGLARDPECGFLALRDGRPVGMAQVHLDDGIWVLAMLTIDPAAQSGGVGRALFERTLALAQGTRGGMLAASQDSRALRLYARAGFELRPTIAARGVPDTKRPIEPGERPVRLGGLDDLELTAAVDAKVRGGARAENLASLIELGDRLYVSDGPHGRGYSIARAGMIAGLAATDPFTAAALLRHALADAGAGGCEVSVSWIAAGHDWAIDVALAAGLALEPCGPLFTRGQLGPLAPFLPSGVYL